MISGSQNLARFAALFLLTTLPAPPAAAQSRLVDEYVAAVQLARAGQTEQALQRLAGLVRQNPTSVPLHRALAVVASRTRQASAWEQTFQQRLSRSPRDRCAEVGLAVLRAERGAKGDAHRLLRAALEAGERDPLLAGLLLETAASRENLTAWLSRQGQARPRDPLLSWIHASVLLSLDRAGEARRVIVETLSRGQEHPDLLTLHAAILRAAGEEKEACREAALAAEELGAGLEFPETRVPRHTGLARALIACGRLEAARRLLSNIGPQVTLPGETPLRPLVRAAEAELALARGDLVDALTQSSEGLAGTAPGSPAEETLRAVRVGAQVRLGTPVEDREALLAAPLPEGLALADRAVALSALALSEPVPAKELVPLLSRLSLKLQQQTLGARASRLELLQGFLLAGSDPEGSRRSADRGARLALRAEVPAASAAAVLVKMKQAAPHGPLRVLAAAEVGPVQLAGSPGALLAAVRVEVARAALAAGQSARAIAAARQGFLDLQEADRSGVEPPAEYRGLAKDPSDLAIELAGLGFRGRIAAEVPLEDAARGFLQDLGRAARGWSQVEVPWPDSLEGLIAGVPKKSCLVVAAIGEAAPALVVNNSGAVGVTTPAQACAHAACAGQRAILWAGPAAAPGGLSCREGDDRALVRLVSPSPLRQSFPEPAPTDPGSLAVVGPGGDRPLRRLLERISGPSPANESADLASRWPAYAGAGLSSSHHPLSSGWLVPPEVQGGSGWLGPEALPLLSPVRGPGCIAAGLRVMPGKGEPEKGSWVLAEAALQAGWRFALLSREPLGAEDLAWLRGRGDGWRASPVNEARRTNRKNPALAARLTLWTLPGKLEAKGSAGGAWRWVAGSAILAAGALLAGRLFSRRRSAVRPSRHRAPRARRM